jgi:glycerol-3-phosphate dehydrogenase
MMWRLIHNYGTYCTKILGTATCEQDLGEHFGADLYQAEVDYLRRHEWVVDSTDLLWRRSKLGLRLEATQVQRLQAYLAEVPPSRT